MTKWYRKYSEILSVYKEEDKEYKKEFGKFVECIHGQKLMDDEEIKSFIYRSKEESGMHNIEITNISIKDDNKFIVTIDMVNKEKSYIKYSLSIYEGFIRNYDEREKIYYITLHDLKILNYKRDVLERKLKNYLDNEIIDLLLNIPFEKDDNFKIDMRYGSYQITKRNHKEYEDLLTGYLSNLRSDGDYLRSLTNLKSYLKSDEDLIEFLENSNMSYREEEVKYNWVEYQIN